MRNPANRRALVLMVLSIGCLLFIVAYMERIAMQARLENEASAWQQENIAAQEHQAALVAQLAYVQTDAYIHQQARDVLNMVLPGDELVVVVERPPAEVADSALPVTTPAQNEQPGQPIWRQWLTLFTTPATQ